MQLKGIELQTTIRLSQPSDAKDVKYTITTTAGANIDANFYSLLFFDMMGGTVTGEDGTPTTGIKFKLYETDDSLFAESDTAKLDWYETETTYVSEALPTISSQAVGSDTFVRDVEVIFNGNDSDADKEVIIFASSALGAVTEAIDDGNGVKGVKLATADGAVTLTVEHRFVIAK